MNTKQYYIIECGRENIDMALKLLDAIKSAGDYYVLNVRLDMMVISMKNVTKEEFNKFNEYE